MCLKYCTLFWKATPWLWNWWVWVVIHYTTRLASFRKLSPNEKKHLWFSFERFKITTNISFSYQINKGKVYIVFGTVRLVWILLGCNTSKHVEISFQKRMVCFSHTHTEPYYPHFFRVKCFSKCFIVSKAAIHFQNQQLRLPLILNFLKTGELLSFAIKLDAVWIH